MEDPETLQPEILISAIQDRTLSKLTHTPPHAPVCPYNNKVINETPLMVTDTTQDMQIRRSIIQSVENMDLRLLQRIAYECRCEELGLHADGWKLFSDT